MTRSLARGRDLVAVEVNHQIDLAAAVVAPVVKPYAAAGILRWKPNIKWGPKPDRGKEPQSLRPKASFPWFWSCLGAGSIDDRTDFAGCKAFDGNRWNDMHYTSEKKRNVRTTSLFSEGDEPC